MADKTVIITCGGRDYNNRKVVEKALWDLIYENGGVGQILIRHGGCRGADLLVDEVAAMLGVERDEHLAEWDLYGKSAGFIRNEKMAKLGADLCLAFPGGNGTAHMVTTARLQGIRVKYAV